jgi:ribosomal protein S18 acetylase RimI-like enzyme
MSPQSSDDVRVERAPGLIVEAIQSLIETCGVHRMLFERQGDTRDAARAYAQLVVDSAAANDAVTLVATDARRLRGLVVVRFPRWDEEQFGFRVARVEHVQGCDRDTLELLAGAVRGELSRRGVRMCSARLSCEALAAIESLEDAGFRFVEVMLSPWRDLHDWEPRGYTVTRGARPDDVERLCAIASVAFRTDRFHRDVRFARDAADGVYARWVRTWMGEQTDARRSLVLVQEGRVSGFFFMELSSQAGAPDRLATVVLNAIDPELAGRGHGFRMYCDAFDLVHREARYCTADVAAANPAVLDLYAGLGFHLRSGGDVTLHWWSVDEEGTCTSL